MNQSFPRNHVDSKISSYEDFIESKLKKDLGEIEALLAKKAENYREWQELKNFVLHVQDRKADELITKFDVGHGVHMTARVEELDKIIVNIGCNCYLDMYYDEASKYVDIRLKYLKREIDFLRGQGAQVKAHTKLVLLAIDELRK